MVSEPRFEVGNEDKMSSDLTKTSDVGEETRGRSSEGPVGEKVRGKSRGRTDETLSRHDDRITQCENLIMGLASHVEDLEKEKDRLELDSR